MDVEQHHPSSAEETHEEIDGIEVEPEDLEWDDQEHGEPGRPREVGDPEIGIPVTGRDGFCRLQVEGGVPVRVEPRMDEEAQTIRRAIFRMWRADERERERTMELLCAENTSTWQLNRVFVKVAALSVSGLVGEILEKRQWRRPLFALDRIHRQLFWLDSRALARNSP